MHSSPIIFDENGQQKYRGAGLSPLYIMSRERRRSSRLVTPLPEPVYMQAAPCACQELSRRRKCVTAVKWARAGFRRTRVAAGQRFSGCARRRRPHSASA